MLHERRLARAVLTDDRDRLARLDRERHAAQRLDAARVAGADVLERDRAPAGRSRTGVQARGRSGGRAGAVRHGHGPRCAASAAATRASSNALAGSAPAASASRTSVGGSSPSGRPPVPSALPRNVERRRTARPRARGSGRCVRSTAGSCSAHSIAPPSRASSASRSATDARCRPDRAARSARRARARPCPSRRCSRSPHAAARRRTARTARARRGARSRAARATASIRASISDRGTREVLEPERELLANGQLRGRQLVGRRGEHDPDPPEERPSARPSEVGSPPTVDPALDPGAHDPRDEAGRRQRERRLAGAGPPGDADPLAGSDGEADAVERVGALRPG